MFTFEPIVLISCALGGEFVLSPTAGAFEFRRRKWGGGGAVGGERSITENVNFLSPFSSSSSPLNPLPPLPLSPAQQTIWLGFNTVKSLSIP